MTLLMLVEPESLRYRLKKNNVGRETLVEQDVRADEHGYFQVEIMLRLKFCC